MFVTTFPGTDPFENFAENTTDRLEDGGITSKTIQEFETKKEFSSQEYAPQVTESEPDWYSITEGRLSQTETSYAWADALLDTVTVYVTVSDESPPVTFAVLVKVTEGMATEGVRFPERFAAEYAKVAVSVLFPTVAFVFTR